MENFEDFCVENPGTVKRYRCIYDGDSFIDGIECETFEEAQEKAKYILEEWVLQAEELDDFEHDMMICNCMTWVDEYDPDTGTWNDIWYPEDEFLEAIGWVERLEED